jgi:fructose-1,6-bisphosphatase/inositol monophosphatase family enzyme
MQRTRRLSPQPSMRRGDPPALTHTPPPMSQSLHPMLNVATKAARAAGAIINRAALDIDLLKISVKGPNDFVSEVDRAAEAAVIEILLQAYPDHGILAEESGSTHGNRTSEYQWIIDPLDGTTNFLHGLPIYAVSIGLAHRNVVQQAVVYDPARNDLFFASRGRGAFLNDRRLRVSKRIALGDALIGTGFPFRRGDNFERYMQMMQSVMQRCAGIRRPDHHRGRRPDRQLHRRARLPAQARDRCRQPQDLRSARAPAGAVHARQRGRSARGRARCGTGRAQDAVAARRQARHLITGRPSGLQARWRSPGAEQGLFVVRARPPHPRGCCAQRAQWITSCTRGVTDRIRVL